jgi:hypothetical protein
MKLTLGQIKSPCCKMLPGMVTTDTRLVDYINEACERLLYKGKWPSCYGSFSIAVTDGLVTWPRQIETIERFAHNNTPGVVQNDWYEWIDTGWGLRDSASGYDGLTLIDRGTNCVFANVSIEPGAFLRVKSSLAADVSPDKILIQGYDHLGNWVRTLSGGVYVDGEWVTLNGVNYVQTVNQFSRVTGIQKTTTDGFVSLWEVDPSTGFLNRLGYYEPTETVPSYRVSLVPGITPDTDPAYINVMAKLRFIKASVDTDYVLPPNLAAIKLMIAAIYKEENNLIAEANTYEANALRVLNEQLDHYLGDGAALVVQNTNMAPPVETVI